MQIVGCFSLKQQIYNQFVILVMKRVKDEQEEYEEAIPQKAKYTKTTVKKKEQLIEMVMNRSLSIYRASKMLKISNSSAKSVIFNYQKYGIILNRNTSIEFQKRQDVKKQEGEMKVKIEEDQKEKQPVQVKDQQRYRVLQNMGLTIDQFPYSTNDRPFYNYPPM